jgi:hypothetical protein
LHSKHLRFCIYFSYSSLIEQIIHEWNKLFLISNFKINLLVKEFSQFFPLYPYWHLQVYELASLLHKPPFLQGLSEHLRTLGAKVVVTVSPIEKSYLCFEKNNQKSIKKPTFANVKKRYANRVRWRAQRNRYRKIFIQT